MAEIIELGEVLEERNRLIDVQDDEEYRCAGVRLNGNGAFVREYKFGTEIKKKHVQHVLKKDDIVYSTLFANKGAFAVADASVDGAILSEKFPTFKLNDSRLSLDYLNWFFRTGQLQRVAAEQVTGMAVFSLSHLSKRKFLKLLVPVPSLERQKYVVEACEKVWIATQNCLPAFNLSLDLSNAIFRASIDKYLESFPKRRIGELGSYQMRNVEIQPDEDYKQITVAMNTKGLRLRRVCKGLEIKSPGQCSVEEGDLLYSRIDLRNGAIGFVPDSLAGGVVTRDFPVFKFLEMNRNLKQFLEYVFVSQGFREQALEHSRGTTGRKKIKRERFLEFSIPWPDESQRNEVVNKIKDLESEVKNLNSGLELQKREALLVENAIAKRLFGEDAGLI